MDYANNWRLLASQIIIEVIEDYRECRDKYRKEALIKWFDTPYGMDLCILAGLDPEYIKQEVKRCV